MIDPADYGIDNLPFGIVSFADDDRPRPAVAYRHTVIDLDRLVTMGALGEPSLQNQTSLNAFLGRGLDVWRNVRTQLQTMLGSDDEMFVRAINAASRPRNAAIMHLPTVIGDYVDFYSSLEHATNLGRILRPGGEPLMPNYRHIPIGYHGRSGTVVVSGTDVHRPHGQRKAPDAPAPTFGASTTLDIELEMGWIGGPGNVHGTPISANDVRKHVFGYVLLNDWSARDIQAWEYQPLGPFLGKSFATSISPWIVTLDALEPFRVAEPKRSPEPLPYLHANEDWAYDIELEMALQTARMAAAGEPAAVLTRTNLRDMYWTVAHQLAHTTSNGATLRPGDLFGTGTISGAQPGSEGSFIELTQRGAQPVTLPNGETRGFLQDGDTVVIRGRAVNGDRRIGFGEVVGTITG